MSRSSPVCPALPSTSHLGRHDPIYLNIDKYAKVTAEESKPSQAGRKGSELISGAWQQVLDHKKVATGDVT